MQEQIGSRFARIAIILMSASTKIIHRGNGAIYAVFLFCDQTLQFVKIGLKKATLIRFGCVEKPLVRLPRSDD
jgi:hypothetical protein